MKRFKLILLMILTSILFIAGCGQGDSTLKGEITEIYEQSARVSVIENNDDFSVGTIVSVDLSVNTDTLFGIGDKVIVGYEGTIRESSPPSISTKSVKLIETE
ncbi:DUF3221 domain-containing protein [Ureibacillus composti]|nr:DUF3221 domain-containing protein [Ureibacillus composti]HWJ79128.1 hypothetical protein [Niallia sp.]